MGAPTQHTYIEGNSMNAKTMKAYFKHKDGTIEKKEIEDKKVWLKVGEKKIAFFIHDYYTKLALSHFESGQRVADLTAIKLPYVHSYRKMTDRAAAELAISRLIEKHGADRVLMKMNTAEKVN